MPLEIGVWRIDDNKADSLELSSLDKEKRLEDILEADISIASPDWLVIGRQVATDHGGLIDLLAINGSGHLVVIELKKQRTPRDVVAQVLDYGSWVKDLDNARIAQIFTEYMAKSKSGASEDSLDEAFAKKFNGQNMPDELNAEHELVVVASCLDNSTERIISYLSGLNIPINAVLFQIFKDREHEYLTRAWLIDPTQPDDVTKDRPTQGIWNEEFYLSFGHGEYRNWEDAVKYGFVSAGQGRWYSRTLNGLDEGMRVWVNIPGTGYVGVGKVTGKAVRVDGFFVKQKDGTDRLLSDLPVKAKSMFENRDDEQNAEYLVPVDWIKTVTIDNAVHEKGFFGNQNTVSRPSARSWQFTIDRLKSRWGIE